MNKTSALLLAAVITFLIVIIAAYMMYNYYNLASFSFTTGQPGTWTVPAGHDVSDLRFIKCIFTVSVPGQTPVTKDVSSVLNGMAVAYTKSANPPTELSLISPLNPFSFVIPGFNDSATVKDPTIPKWTNAKVSLVGKVRIL
jgi:hypothetical protein